MQLTTTTQNPVPHKMFIGLAILAHYYNKLELPLFSSFTQVKRAYRRLVRVCHPDKTSDPVLNTRFHQVQKAYEFFVKLNDGFALPESILHTLESNDERERLSLVPILFQTNFEHNHHSNRTTAAPSERELLGILSQMPNLITTMLGRSEDAEPSERELLELLSQMSNLIPTMLGRPEDEEPSSISIMIANYYLLYIGILRRLEERRRNGWVAHIFNLPNRNNNQDDDNDVNHSSSAAFPVSTNHREFELYHGDPTTIPDELLCPLSATLLTEPVSCSAKGLPVVERCVIMHIINTTGKNPYNRVSLDYSDLQDESALALRAHTFLLNQKLPHPLRNNSPLLLDGPAPVESPLLFQFLRPELEYSAASFQQPRFRFTPDLFFPQQHRPTLSQIIVDKLPKFASDIFTLLIIIDIFKGAYSDAIQKTLCFGLCMAISAGVSHRFVAQHQEDQQPRLGRF